MPNVYRVRSLWTGVAGAPWFSTQFFEALTAVSATGAQDAASAVSAFWSAAATIIHSDGTLDIEDTVDVLDELTGELVDSFTTTTTPTQPSEGGDKLPPATQGLLRIDTGVILDGSRIKGRVFIPAPTEFSSTGGAPSAAYQTTLDTAANSLIASTANMALCVWHRPKKAGDPPVLVRNGQAVEANSVTPSATWAILRSRRD